MNSEISSKQTYPLPTSPSKKALDDNFLSQDYYFSMQSNNPHITPNFNEQLDNPQ